MGLLDHPVYVIQIYFENLTLHNICFTKAFHVGYIVHFFLVKIPLGKSVSKY